MTNDTMDVLVSESQNGLVSISESCGDYSLNIPKRIYAEWILAVLNIERLQKELIQIAKNQEKYRGHL